jgi:hypothetical protein
MKFMDNFFMVVAFLTDFGTKDYFVAAMKGVIFSINPEATIVDITHEIPPQDIASAAFVLKACYGDFPQGTIFVCVVDPGVGSDRRAIVVEIESYNFVAPDNGLLDLILGENKDFKAFNVTNKEYLRVGISNTFHGRDIFAPVAAHLSKGIPPAEFGEQIDLIVQPQSGEREFKVIYIDHFGNLVTNIRNDEVPNHFELEINGRRISKLREFYAEAEFGELFMICGSAGFLEIAIRDGSAQTELGVKPGTLTNLKILAAPGP